MDGVISVFEWATSTLQGLALMEGIVILALGAVTWKVLRIEKRIDAHEATCNAQYAANAQKFAALDERTKNIQDDLKTIKEHLLSKK